jgi:hypothetical protein
VLKTILEAGAAYPLLRELMSFAQVDKTKLTEKAKEALGELTQELAPPPILEPEPEPVTNRGKVSHAGSAE